MPDTYVENTVNLSFLSHPLSIITIAVQLSYQLNPPCPPPPSLPGRPGTSCNFSSDPSFTPLTLSQGSKTYQETISKSPPVISASQPGDPARLWSSDPARLWSGDRGSGWPW